MDGQQLAGSTHVLFPAAGDSCSSSMHAQRFAPLQEQSKCQGDVQEPAWSNLQQVQVVVQLLQQLNTAHVALQAEQARHG